MNHTLAPPTYTEILVYTNISCIFFVNRVGVGIVHVQFILAICTLYVGGQVLNNFFFYTLFFFALFLFVYDDDNSVKIISKIHLYWMCVCSKLFKSTPIPYRGWWVSFRIAGSRNYIKVPTFYFVLNLMWGRSKRIKKVISF